MSAKSQIPTPVPLLLQRLRYQILPIVTLLASASLAAFIWARHVESAIGTGEVEAIRVHIESKSDGVLEEIPRPVNLFDVVQSGQIVARLDTRVQEAELRRLEAELAEIQNQPTTAPAKPSGKSSIEWYHARIDEIQAKLNAKDLKATLSGTITEIHKRPGEGTVSGKPILTIAAEHGSCIIGYFRPDQSLRPVNGMTVIVQPRVHGSASFTSYISSVGAQIEQLPPRHWKNSQVPDWGLPVQIALPESATLKPGEMVDLVLKPRD